MEKIYMVYEGHLMPLDLENECGSGRMVAVYPLEDMARHHLELWVSKMLPIIGKWNKEESEMLKKRVNDGLDNEYDFQPWIPKPGNDKYSRAFVKGDEEFYVLYSEADVLHEVRLE